MTTFSIRIDRMALEGDGVGRDSTSKEPSSASKVAFVPYSVPGEEILARPYEEKKNFFRLIPEKILKKSPNRIEPACPIFFKPNQRTPWCGGCNWQHVSYEAQLEYKRELVKESLVRIGGVVDPLVHPTLSSGEAWRYRNKVQVPFGGDRKNLKAGFFAPDSHEIVPFQDCLIQPESALQIVEFIKQSAKAFGWAPYDEDRHSGWLRHVMVRINQKGEAIVVLVTKDSWFKEKNVFIEQLRRACPFVIALYQNIQPARSHVILGRHWIQLGGADRLDEPMAGLKLSYSPSSFFQVNTKAAEKLYLKAIEELDIQPSSLVYDLFCGVGAMTIMAAKKGKHAVGIEVASSSIRDAQFNAQQNYVRNVSFLESPVEDYLKHHIIEDSERYLSNQILVLIDPPRTGCSPIVLERLLKLEPRRIVYVSCHPATLARDVKILSPKYKVKQVTPVDMFSQTAHIESVTTLEKK